MERMRIGLKGWLSFDFCEAENFNTTSEKLGRILRLLDQPH
jgi:hypothetical protein